jgi:hypothetical protein
MIVKSKNKSTDIKNNKTLKADRTDKTADTLKSAKRRRVFVDLLVITTQMICFLTISITVLKKQLSNEEHPFTEIIAGSAIGLFIGFFIKRQTDQLIKKYKEEKSLAGI